VNRLSSPELIDSLEEASLRVFKNLDAYEVAFTPEIECRFVLFPVDHYRLTKDQFVALGRAAVEAVHDNSAYLFDVEQWTKFGWDRKRREYWLLSLDDYEAYENPPDDANIVIIQNAIVSTSGRWGMVISDENHAIVGGSKEFVSRFLDALQVNKNEMRNLWLRHWHRNQKELGYETSWLSRQVDELTGAN
jgi:hypothetical protein